MTKAELMGMGRNEMEGLFVAGGEPRYRGRQLYRAVYRERRFDLSRITAFPKVLRQRLAEQWQATLPEVESAFQSADGTVRYLLRLADGKQIESVYMPEEKRKTLCISTQAGCPLDCQFCLTGVLGFTRNLSAGEIVGQVLRLFEENRWPAGEAVNLVFMGMGEPLLNYDNVLAAVRLLADPDGIGISPQRMTLSTAGVVAGIERLGKEAVRPKLAVSLNASTDATRNRIMPINRKWPIAELLRACREFPLRPREKLTFEYVLLDGVNDSMDDARRLARLVKPLRCKVNLIGLNPGPELPFQTPPDRTVLAFQQVLREAGVPAFIRKPRGRDIYAACGQLRLAQEPAGIGGR
ncbi:MAG TPA: 23S rRNA (adenine(2503)-C(2))-methyltransferase RlmN [Terriglobia bacterium]|nr:23S rRNA (adenine(2503)-C(2))-methyltransferase RlmN [Terriglobia bacterium]